MFDKKSDFSALAEAIMHNPLSQIEKPKNELERCMGNGRIIEIMKQEGYCR